MPVALMPVLVLVVAVPLVLLRTWSRLALLLVLLLVRPLLAMALWPPPLQVRRRRCPWQSDVAGNGGSGARVRVRVCV